MIGTSRLSRFRAVPVTIGLSIASFSALGQEAASPADDPGGGSTPTPARDAASFSGPDAVDNQLREDFQLKPNFFDLNILEPYEAFKKDVYDRTGFKFGGDYTALLLAATDSLGDDTAAGGILRFYGSWDLIGRGTVDTGGLIYKIEHRHRYTDIPPSALASDVGYVGLFEPPFSNEGTRLTNLYWRQSLFENRFVTYVGFLDATDFVDAYALASPWTGFNNFVFSTGSATIALPNDATLGAMAGLWITDQVYAIGSLTDANADPTDPFEGFSTFFDEFETFKSIELGWTPGKDEFFLTNMHVTLWHLDEREQAGTPDGWGVNVSGSTWIDEMWLPFIRAGWAEDGGSLLEASVSAGFGYQRERGGDVLGVGLNWGRPNRDTFGADLDDQYTGEVFYRWQLAQNVQLTPSVQVLIDSALNPDESAIAVFGVRARLTF
jgi:porin